MRVTTQAGVGEDVVPIGERSIGSDDDGTQLIASSDHLEEQVGVAVVVVEVAYFVDG